MLEYIIGTMLAAGTVGGLINLFLSDTQLEKPLAFWQHIIVGVGAAFIVPVFLNTISSNLISEIAGPEITSEVLSKLLVLAGFCLLAAVSSRAFIRSMTNRLLQEVSALKEVARQAKEQAENAEAIAELTIEPEAPEPTTKSHTNIDTPTAELTGPERKILKAMIESSFSMRSATGLAMDTKTSMVEVNKVLSRLLDRSLIAKAKSKDGRSRWYPTPQGRQAANAS